MTAVELSPADQRDLDVAEAYQDGRAAGWAAGVDAGLNARPPVTCWVPTDRPWRSVRPGTLIVGDDATLWYVSASGPHGIGWRLTLAQLGALHAPGAYDGDPDELIPVLVPAAERDAIATLTDAGLRPRPLDAEVTR